MKWTLAELHKYSNEALHIASTFDLKASLLKRFPNKVLDAEPVVVDGYVTYDNGDATVSAHVKGQITVPSSRSLNPVDFPLDFTFNESYTTGKSHLDEYDDSEVVFLLKDSNETIDFDRALEENIIEQIPTRILTPDEQDAKRLPAGKGWDIVEDDEIAHEDDNHVDPRFAKLKKLFPDQDEDN